MKTIFLVLVAVCLAGNGFGQKNDPIKPLFIGGMLPNLTFPHVINYKDSIATLLDFQAKEKKLVIFDFWNTHCGSCIRQFPKEDSLQKLFKSKVQFVLVTFEPEQTVKTFITRWERLHHQQLSMPIIVEDTTLSNKYISVFYEPQFAWVDHDNQLIAQTSAFYLDSSVIEVALKRIDLLKADEERAKKWRDNQKQKGQQDNEHAQYSNL